MVALTVGQLWKERDRDGRSRSVTVFMLHKRKVGGEERTEVRASICGIIRLELLGEVPL